MSPLPFCLRSNRSAVVVGPNSARMIPGEGPASEEDLQIFYIQCRHFPERSKKFGIDALEPIMKPLRDQSFNTLSCSYMTLALKAYSDLARSTGVEVSILGIVNGNS